MNHIAPLDASPKGALKIPAFRPNGDRIVIQPDTVDERTKGGIWLPQKTVSDKKQDVSTGRVVAMGPGLLCSDGTRFPMPDVKIGDRVLYYNQGGIKLPLEEGEYLSMRDDFILCVLEEGGQ